MKLSDSKRLRVMLYIICGLIVILAVTIIVTMVRVERLKREKRAGRNVGAIGVAYNAEGELGYYDSEEKFVAVPTNAVILGESNLQKKLVSEIFDRQYQGDLNPDNDNYGPFEGEDMSGRGNASKVDSSEIKESGAILPGLSMNPGTKEADAMTDEEKEQLDEEYRDNRQKYLEMLGFARPTVIIDGNTEDEDGNSSEENTDENPDGTDTGAEGTQDPEDGQTPDGAEENQEPEITFLNVYSAGIEDPSVAVIQEKLMQLGFMENSEPTQRYGPITMEAVKLFQRQNDLKQDGIIGEQTIAILFAENPKSYLLKRDMVGNDIRDVQKRLYELGYLASLNQINGTYDENTEKAVKSLQAANSLVADGKIGAYTNELLYSEEVKANLISFGDKSDIVLECQKKLQQLGYLTTAPDGYYGADTQAAVKQFQSKNDCIVDGYLGPSTRAVLNSSSAKPNGLALGEDSDNVKNVQKLLIKYGYLDSGNDTGYFGEKTEAAVKAFQKNNGLTSDGKVGQKTMSVLQSDSVVKAGGNTGGTGGTDDKNKDKDKDKDKDKKQDEGGDSDSGTVSYSGNVDDLIALAKTKIGCKYVYGSKGPNTFDCSGFVYWCLKQVGVEQSYITSYSWRTVGKYKKITDFNSIKKGDVVVVYGHVGLAAGNGEVIDASSSAGEIVYRTMGDWWKRNFICAWRIFG